MKQQERDQWNGNWGKHLIFNRIKVEMIEIMSEFITHDHHV
jgi:hypothetical protein